MLTAIGRPVIAVMVARRLHAVEFSDEFPDIFGTPDKGKRNQDTIFDRKLEILAVFGC